MKTLAEIDLTTTGGARIGIALEFKLADMWVGVFWRVKDRGDPCGCLVYADGSGRVDEVVGRRLDVWFCLIPTLPIHIWRDFGVTRRRP